MGQDINALGSLGALIKVNNKLLLSADQQASTDWSV